MRVLQINSLYGFGSTGTIAKLISDEVEKSGGEAFAACRLKDKGYPNVYMKGNKIDWKFHALMTRVDGRQGYFSKGATKKLLRHIDNIKPDIVHLHNLHDNYINFNMLCDYLAKKNIPTVITLHDCWPFTGKCWYYTAAACDKWQGDCGSCPMLKDEVPSWFFDKTAKTLKDKCEHLNKIPSLTLVGCSDWIAEEARKSHLASNNIVTIHNGIDLNVFKPSESNFRAEYGISEGDFVILGVAAQWSERKGFDVFLKLAEDLSKNIKIVLVGKMEDGVKLPERVIAVPRTESREKLAEIYSAADLFVNPTREDNFPTVNIEALACGTSVLTFKIGGSPECIDESSGSVVDCDDIEGLEKEIAQICSVRPFTKENCIRRAKTFDADDKYKEYYDLYCSLQREF